MTFWAPVDVDLGNGDMHQSRIRLNQPKYVKIVILHYLQLTHCLISCAMASPGAHMIAFLGPISRHLGPYLDILGTGGCLIYAIEICIQLESH